MSLLPKSSRKKTQNYPPLQSPTTSNLPNTPEENTPTKNSAAPASPQASNNPKPNQTKRRLIILIASIIVVVLAAIIALVLLFMPHVSEVALDTNGEDAATPDIIYYSPLTGREVANAAAMTEATTCIMVENSPEARPQSGLTEAGIVYEAIAEGGITRFMAIYQQAKPNYIGPVRSVRLYYAQWATPYQCSIAHVGGAADALDLIRNNSLYRDIDQFFNGNSYWRISSRYAPHNVYTSFEKLDALNQSKGYTTSEFAGFERIDPAQTPAIPDTPISNIAIQMSSALYNPVYSYDPNTKTYLRSYQSGGSHLDVTADGTKTQIAPNVVIALAVEPTERAGSDYPNYVTTGTGTAYVFQNGGVIKGSWQRETTESELQLLDESGNTISLNPGQVWTSAYPSTSGSVTYQ